MPNNFSPTPWHADYADGYFVLDSEGCGVVEAMTPCGNHVTDEANVHLVERAPTLLDVLQRLLPENVFISVPTN